MPTPTTPTTNPTAAAPNPAPRSEGFQPAGGDGFQPRPPVSAPSPDIADRRSAVRSTADRRSEGWTSTEVPLSDAPRPAAGGPAPDDSPSTSIFDDIRAAAGLPPAQPTEAPSPEIADRRSDSRSDDPPAQPTEPPSPNPAADPNPADRSSDGRPRNSRDLRHALESALAEVASLKAEIAKPKPREPDPETARLAAELETLRSTKTELEQRLQFTDYERSPDYQRSYAKPLEDALQAAYADMPELVVSADDGSRPATPDDFNRLLRLPLQQAIRQASETFGDAAPHVLNLRRQVMDLNTRRQKALDDFKASAKDREASTAAQRAAVQQVWNAHLAELTEKFPQLYATDEADPVGNDLFLKGQALADAALLNPPQDASPQDLARLRAEVRFRAAAFGRMVHRHQALTERVQALETELAQYRQSTPGAGSPGAPATTTPKSWREEIQDLARG